MEKVLMKGNEAFAEAAMRGGAQFYFGYPITPQNEIPEYLSRELPKRGGRFLQAESELAAINMAYGVGASGGAAFVSSSSPGIALMQEGVSFLCSAEVPVAMLNVSRGGPGVGSIQPGQADYNQNTRGGGNGDYHVPVFAPATMQEAVDLLYEATELARKWRNPVLISADGVMGQMMEPIVLPEAKPYPTEDEIDAICPWAITGGDGTKRKRLIRSLYMKPDELEIHLGDLFEKYNKMEKELLRYQTTNVEDAEVVFVAYGTMSRLVGEAMEMLGEKGIRCGMIRPISLWPYPYEAFDKIGKNCRLVISAELSMGQMIQDVRLGALGRWPVQLINRSGGILPTSTEIVERTLKFWEELK